MPIGEGEAPIGMRQQPPLFRKPWPKLKARQKRSQSQNQKQPSPVFKHRGPRQMRAGVCCRWRWQAQHCRFLYGMPFWIAHTDLTPVVVFVNCSKISDVCLMNDWKVISYRKRSALWDKVSTRSWYNNRLDQWLHDFGTVESKERGMTSRLARVPPWSNERMQCFISQFAYPLTQLCLKHVMWIRIRITYIDIIHVPLMAFCVGGNPNDPVWRTYFQMGWFNHQPDGIQADLIPSDVK